MTSARAPSLRWRDRFNQFGGILSAVSCLVSVTADDVARIRTEYLSQAVLQVRELATHSSIDARHAAGELRRYFKSAQDGLLPEQRGPLFKQLQALCKALALRSSGRRAGLKDRSTQTLQAAHLP